MHVYQHFYMHCPNFTWHLMENQIFCEELANCQLKTRLFGFMWTGLSMSKLQRGKQTQIFYFAMFQT